ncbi:hypothetical protein [Sphingosinithalassobacter portus]|uniref:hypothetical protein n=1 Tax=Stakelama portus TaxID=2676234 RepID=UPI0011AB378E|nr:hypothetical protein [Sphingosinithalassobacter portus]
MSTPPPLVSESQQLTERWSATLPFPMARRIDDGALVFWHSPKRLTLWLLAFNPSEDGDPLARLADLRAGASSDGFDATEEQRGGVLRFAYRLREDGEDDRQPAFYGFAVGPDGSHIFLSAYFDSEEQVEDARSMWRSLTWSDQPAT